LFHIAIRQNIIKLGITEIEFDIQQFTSRRCLWFTNHYSS